MGRELSIRKRILLGLVVGQAIVTTALATAGVMYSHRQRLAAFDSELQRRMTITLAMVQSADEKPGGIEFAVQPGAIPSGDLFEIWDDRGTLIAVSTPSANILKPLVENPYMTYFESAGSLYRGELWHSVPLVDQETEENNQPRQHVDLAYAVPAKSLRTDLLKVTAVVATASLLWLTTSCFIAWIAVSKGLIPLDELAAHASTIDEPLWNFQPAPTANSIAELQPLIGALHGLISRLKSAFERERTFVSDVAHELKTAVAIQKSTLQVAANGPQNVVEYRRGFDRALSDLDRLESLVLRMLSLASVESPMHDDTFARTALHETVLAACEQVASLAALRRVELSTSQVLPGYVNGNSTLLQTVWVALIENAIRYSSPDSTVDIAVNQYSPDVYEVQIRDTGQGIAGEDLGRVFDRFYRGDRSRSRETGGHGLGLAIAKAIVERHKGTIKVDSVLGVGTNVRVQLPILNLYRL